MRYFGGKFRLAKYLLPVILKEAKPRQTYVEPFVGGCNVIDKVCGCRRIAGDANPYVICLFKALQKGWLPPEGVTEEEYDEVLTTRRDSKREISPRNAFISLGGGFSGKQWGAYSYDYRFGRNTSLDNARIALISQAPDLKGVEFNCCKYFELNIPANSLIYCDPPYRGVKLPYPETGDFDSDAFWLWVETMSRHGHTIFVSEYSAPMGFEAVWEKEVPLAAGANNSTTCNKATEKLFKWIAS